jgi:hypothetical protein
MIVPDPDALGAIIRRGRPALAWEVLRRDPRYQAAFARLAAPPAAGIAAEPAFVADWGLHFP